MSSYLRGLSGHGPQESSTHLVCGVSVVPCSNRRSSLSWMASDRRLRGV